VQADEGIQDQKLGLDCRHRGSQTFPILWEIKQESRGRDHIEGEILQPGLGRNTDTFQPLAYHA
jgi:hypothetical protein